MHFLGEWDQVRRQLGAHHSITAHTRTRDPQSDTQTGSGDSLPVQQRLHQNLRAAQQPSPDDLPPPDDLLFPDDLPCPDDLPFPDDIPPDDLPPDDFPFPDDFPPPDGLLPPPDGFIPPNGLSSPNGPSPSCGPLPWPLSSGGFGGVLRPR